MFRPPTVNGLNSPIVPFYGECEMTGVVTNLYLFQKPAGIFGESGSFIKIRIDFLEK